MTTDEATTSEQTGMVRISLHIEVETHEKLLDRAADADRTFAAEVRRRLRESIESENGKARA